VEYAPPGALPGGCPPILPALHQEWIDADAPGAAYPEQSFEVLVDRFDVFCTTSPMAKAVTGEESMGRLARAEILESNDLHGSIALPTPRIYWAHRASDAVSEMMQNDPSSIRVVRGQGTPSSTQKPGLRARHSMVLAAG